MYARDNFASLTNQTTKFTDFADIRGLLDEATSALGFDHYALIRHVWDRPASIDAVRIVDYPKGWLEMMAKHGYLKDDPGLRASEKTVAPFDWSALPRLLSLTPRQEHIVEEAKRAGLGNGFIVPLHMPGEYSGSCTFAVKVGRDIPIANYPAAQFVASYAFEAARRLVRTAKADHGKTNGVGSTPSITPRQQDCMVLAAQGKTDWDIGKVLGISGVTVHKHLEAIKKRYGVSTRTQLVVRALFDGVFSFNDVLH